MYLIQVLIITTTMAAMIQSLPYSGGLRNTKTIGRIGAGDMIRLGQNNGGILTQQHRNAHNNYASLFRSLTANTGTSGAVGAPGIIPITVQTKHNIEYKDIPSSGTIQTATVEVGAKSIPINIIFRSASSSLNVLQKHQGAIGDTQESTSEDEPHRLLHTVTKPIIQEIHEVISPYRKILQEVHPVQEEIKTVVAKNSGNINLGSNQQPVASGQSGRPLIVTSANTQYAAAASNTKNHHIQASPLILDSLDSSSEDDLIDNSSGAQTDFQKLIHGTNAIISSTSILKGTDIDGKSIPKTLDQSLSKSVAAMLKTPSMQSVKNKSPSPASSSQSTSISLSTSSSSSSSSAVAPSSSPSLKSFQV